MATPFDVPRVLRPARVVQTELLSHLVEPLLGCPQSHDLSSRISRRDLEDQEHEQHDPQQQRDGEQQPLQNEPEPAHRTPPTGSGLADAIQGPNRPPRPQLASQIGS